MWLHKKQQHFFDRELALAVKHMIVFVFLFCNFFSNFSLILDRMFFQILIQYFLFLIGTFSFYFLEYFPSIIEIPYFYSIFFFLIGMSSNYTIWNCSSFKYFILSLNHLFSITILKRCNSLVVMEWRYLFSSCLLSLNSLPLSNAHVMQEHVGTSVTGLLS